MKRGRFKSIKQSLLRRTLLSSVERLFNELRGAGADRAACLDVAAQIADGRVAMLRFTLAVPSRWPDIELLTVELPMPHPILTIDSGVTLTGRSWRDAGLPRPAGCWWARSLVGLRVQLTDLLCVVDKRRDRVCPTTVECKLRCASEALQLETALGKLCAWGTY